MKLFLLLSILLFSFRGYTKGMFIEFSCSENAPVKVINVYLNDQGQAVFDPDITERSTVLCLTKFQMKVRQEVLTFKSKYCLSSSDLICKFSSDYVNSKIREKIDNVSSEITATTTVDSTFSTTTAQKELEGQIGAGQINPRDLNQTFQHQGKTYKVSDFDGVVGQNIENVFSSMTREEAKQYTQNYLVAKSTIVNNRTPSPERSQVLSNLEKMFGYIHGEKGEEELTKVLECAPQDNITTIADVLDQVSKSEKVAKCSSLRPGEHKVFEEESSDFYGTGNYLLRRTPEGNYQAIVNVKFKSGTGPRAVSPADMMKRVKVCLNEASPYLKGPNGEKLQLVALAPEEINRLPSNQQPRQNEISIENAEYRNSSRAYAETIDCPTIAHELLHLLGLCDEYQETDASLASKWSCRIVTKAPSIMRDHTSAYEDIVGRSQVCNCSTPTCQGIMNSGNEKLKKLFLSESIYNVIDYSYRNAHCREIEHIGDNTASSADHRGKMISDRGNNFSIEHLQIDNPNVSPYYKIKRTVFYCKCPAGNTACLQGKAKIIRDLSEMNSGGSCPQQFAPYTRSGAGALAGSVQYPELLMTSKPKVNGSLLAPNHFKKILAGNCPGVADGYLDCAKWAYKGQVDGPCNSSSQCNDDSYYLGTPK